MKRLGTDYLDIGMIHYVDSESDFEKVFGGEIIEYCKELKAEDTPCSVGINVADINKYLNLALAQGEVPETVADHYKLLVRGNEIKRRLT